MHFSYRGILFTSHYSIVKETLKMRTVSTSDYFVRKVGRSPKSGPTLKGSIPFPAISVLGTRVTSHLALLRIPVKNVH